MRDYDSLCVSETGLGEVPTRASWAIRAGLVAGVLTLVLRLVGVVVGPFAVLLALAAIVLLPGPKAWADRFLVAAAALLGWLPVLGWIPKLGRTVDIEGILLALAVGFATAHQVNVRSHQAERNGWIKPSEALALAVSAGVAIWWGIPLLGKTAAGRLRLLLPGWDNPTHLSFLRLNIKLGSFVTVQPKSPAGVRIDAAEYPQGWHQTWAQWVRLWFRHPPSDSHALVRIYSVALVMTAGIAVLLGCLAVARLCRDHAWMALTSMAVVAQLFAVGVLSMTVWFGFPNFGLAVMAVAIAPSILLRPTLRPPATFFVVSGLMLVGVYNWWPLGLLVIPTLAVASWRLWEYAGVAGRRPFAATAIGFAALATLAPIAVTLHLGSSHLNINGGIPPTPWWLVFASAFGLIAGLAIRHVVTGDQLITLVFGAPAVLGTLGVIGVMAYNISSSAKPNAPGTVGYYGQKLGDAVAAFALVGLALLLADALARSAPRLRVSRFQGAMVGLAAVLASVAVFQVDGYVGPKLQTIGGSQPAPGFLTAQQWTRLDHGLDPLAGAFLDAADATRAKSKELGVFPETWSYIDIENLDLFGESSRPDWVDLWFSALVGDLTSPRLKRAYSLFSALSGVTDPAAAANTLTQLFPPNGGSGVRLVVPDSLVAPLVQLGWTQGTNVFARSAL